MQHGDTLTVRVQATDGDGLDSAWGPVHSLVVDLAPPTNTVILQQQTVSQGQQVTVQDDFTLLGLEQDNRGIGRVEVCVAGECGFKELTAAPRRYVYEDAPALAAPIDSSVTCDGNEIIRSFVVSDAFVVGAVQLGFNATHSFRDDLNVWLRAPSGAEVQVIASTGNQFNDGQDYDVLLSDMAPDSLYSAGDDNVDQPYFDRMARPHNPLYDLHGEAAAGTWQLIMCDAIPDVDDGAYNRAQLILTPADDSARSGEWSFPVDVDTESDGLLQTVQVMAQDELGNQAQALEFTVWVDNVAPVITVSEVMTAVSYADFYVEVPPDPASGDDVAFAITSTTIITGLVTDGSQISQLYLTLERPDGKRITETLTLNGSQWSYDLYPHDMGIYRMWIMAVDSAGNATQGGPFECELFVPTFTLTMHTEGNGTVTLDPLWGAYDYRTSITLNAVPAPGFYFAGWSGDLLTADNPETLVMDGDKVVTATFSAEPPVTYTLTVHTVGNGSVDPAGGTYISGTMVALTASADIDSTFVGWSGACGGTGDCVVTMDAAKTVTATFDLLTYALTVNTAGDGSGTVDPAGGAYTYGTVVTLIATANSGSTFAGWSGACSGMGDCVVTMDAAKTVTATFDLLGDYTLTVNTAGDGSGTVALDPAGGTYAYGTVVTLTATADSGSTFAGWSGACGGAGDCVVTMDAAKSVTATFDLLGHDMLYVSARTDGIVHGLFFADEDILAFDPGTGSWSKFFDGSDVGFSRADLDAFTVLDDGGILMSLDRARSIAGLGWVDDSDIVKFVPTTLGDDTSGSFEWFFDGSDVGLTTYGEDVDAIGFAPNGQLIVSTSGNFQVNGVSGRDEDLLSFDATSLGASTSGTWASYFDGSDVGLTTWAEDVGGVWIDDESGEIYLSTQGSFAVSGASGDGADVLLFAPDSLGDSTNGTFSLFWDGSAYGLSGEVVDALSIAESVTPEASVDLVLSKTDSADPVTTGAAVTYTLGVINDGPDTAHQVFLTDTLPTDVMFDTVTSDQGMCYEASGTVTCNLGDIASGQGVEVTIVVTTTVAGVITNTAVVASDGVDLNPDDNSVSEDTTINPPEGFTVLYISASTSGNVDGIDFDDEDILAYDVDTGTWSRHFDGSDVGLGETDVDGFALMENGDILLSLAAPRSITGLGWVDDSDIVRFVPTSLGNDTAGSFEWYFDGSDVGLTRSGEDIDALSVTSDGKLLLSTIGSFSAPGIGGRDEDLILFTPTSLGRNTSGAWARYFDGSDVGLRRSSEDVLGGQIDEASGDIYLTTNGNFAVPGLSGDGADILVCTPGTLGADTSCTFSLYWDGSAHGLAGEQVDAFAIGGQVVVNVTTSNNAGLNVAEVDVMTRHAGRKGYSRR